MKILGLIPARGGSKGVPRKNIKLLNGKPLIQYTIDAAKKSKYLSRIIVSTDDLEIAEISRKLGIEVPFMRPKELSNDNTPTLDVIIHTISYFNSIGNTFDGVCLLQPTCPFRTTEFIDRAVEKYINTAVDCLVSVLPVPHQFNPHWVFEVNSKGYLTVATGDEMLIPRRQDLPLAYYRDGSVYILNSNNLLNRNTLLGEQLGFIENDPNYNVNIDTISDWNIAEELMRKNFG
jgi:CMP-N-acetylneuraminic acid synthetase